MWTLGTKHPLDTITEMQEFTLAGVAQRIRSDVLIPAETEDHFIPFERVAKPIRPRTGEQTGGQDGAFWRHTG